MIRPASNHSGVSFQSMSALRSSDIQPGRAGKATSGPILGDVEISDIGTLLADRARCRILMALNDGRALPASVLAVEAGVARSTVSSHLGKLTEAGLLQAEPRGRHRYYRLAGPQVARLLEQLTQMAPARPVRSLREGTRAAQLRSARTCYDHLAGQLGVSVMASMLDRGCLDAGNAPGRSGQPPDGLAGYGRDINYALTRPGWKFLDHARIKVPDTRLMPVRYCVDWSEQRHHLAGPLGRAILDRFIESSWILRRETGRSVSVTPEGRTALAELFGIDWVQQQSGSVT
jgi:DNA-binding transcriptional ArsR family regulator